jgi:anti-sigma factor RsiW
MNAALHNLTGAYAAQALADTERVSFERHLDACPGCAQEVRELAETTARLGAAVATAPPPGLWDRVRAEALATGQVPSPRCGSGRCSSRRRCCWWRSCR